MGKALLSLLGSFTILTIELMKPFKRRTITLKWPGHVKIHYIDPPAVWWIKCLLILWREVGTKNKEKSQLSELTSFAWEFIWLWKSLRTSPNTVSAKNIRLVSDNSMVLGVRIGLLNTNWHYNPRRNDAKQRDKFIKLLSWEMLRARKQCPHPQDCLGLSAPITLKFLPKTVPIGWFLLNVFLSVFYVFQFLYRTWTSFSTY